MPTQIGRYRIERLLGQGAMGSVYLGRDPELDRAIAVKTVRHLDLEEDRLKTFLERFRNEARAAARLSHPAIVAVYDVGEDPEVGPYLVFEYVAGSTLKQIVRSRGPLGPEAAVRLGRQIAAAIDTAHAAGVIHRDIKPDNILMSSIGDAKLADFGVARVPDAALTKEGQFLGTPCYAAPETLESGHYGPHSDIFSFAAVLYEAISGERAFPGDDAISVAHHVVHDHPKAPSVAAPGVHIPKEVDAVLLEGLAKDPESRTGTASDLVEALRRAYVEAGLLEDDATGAHPLPPRPLPPEGSARAWPFIAALATLLVAGVGLVIALGDFGGPTSALPPTGSPTDAGSDGSSEVEEDAGELTQALDANVIAIVPVDAGFDAGELDAGESEEPEEDALDPEAMSAFEREEAAKDAIARAASLLDDGDRAAARRAVERARRLDPGNADIPALEGRLQEVE